MSNDFGIAITGGADNDSRIEIYRDNSDPDTPIVFEFDTGEDGESGAITVSEYEATIIASYLANVLGYADSQSTNGPVVEKRTTTWLPGNPSEYLRF